MENNNQSDQNINPRIRAIVLGVHRIYNLRNTQQTFNENDQQQNRDDGDTEENEMAQKKKQRFVGNIPVDTQGKRINEKINFGEGSAETIIIDSE